ncbi:MAG TPA: hypothetical protein VF102_11905 [Gemmatimonadaceae bacterium]
MHIRAALDESHPLGEVLIVTAGSGPVQREGGRLEHVNDDQYHGRRI